MNLLQTLKLPLSLLQVISSAKSFIDNPVLGSPKLNEWGLHRSRCAIAARMATWRRKRLSGRLDPVDLEAIDTNGLVIKSDFLPAETFEQLRREVLEQSWETLEMRQGSTITRRVPFDLGTLAKRAPTLAQFVKDGYVSDLLRYAASTDGRPIFSLQAIFADGGIDSEDPQTLPHQDTFHATSKAWFFLHDVGPNDGPFFYVPGSHRRTQTRLDWERKQSLTAAGHPVLYHARGSFRISEAELAELSFVKPEPLAVKANTLVIADVSGFHGRTPSPSQTIRFEVHAVLRRNPFLPWLGLHIWNLPLLNSHLGTIERMVCHLVERHSLRKFGFRGFWPIGGRKPIDAPVNPVG